MNIETLIKNLSDSKDHKAKVYLEINHKTNYDITKITMYLDGSMLLSTGPIKKKKLGNPDWGIE